MNSRKTPLQRLWYGGDYNPEQWPQAVWSDDVRLMKRANVTVATVGVFSWGLLETSDGEFDFTWLDDVLDTLHAAGIRVDLATATASPPAWLVREHPDIRPVTADGVRLEFGSRQVYNPSSATYRRYATRLVRRLAERYGAHPALEAWHVNNEFGCHVGRDYSPESASAFRTWLERRYGSVDALNDAWGTAFWSQHYSSFDQVEPPRSTPATPNPTQVLDFDRFSSDALLDCYLAELAVLREVTPEVPVTTNFMGFFKPVDYWRWAPHVDFVSDDHYPDPFDPSSAQSAAMSRDLMRSLGGGAPWVLMEQAPSAVNWRRVNAAKPAGMHRLLSLQAVARGADGIMQFQWRQAAAGSEKFHSAMVPHSGEDTRIFRETTQLGADLASLDVVRGTRSTSRVAIVLDWESWWALEQDSMPAQLSYLDEIRRWHGAFWREGVLVDFTRSTGDLTPYDVVVAPTLFAPTDDAVANLASVPERGGQLVVTYQSGIVDEHLHARLGGYLGELQDVLGLWVEEFFPLEESASVGIDGALAGSAHRWSEMVRVTDADVVSRFSSGELTGWPAVTRRSIAEGSAWYVATSPDTLEELVRQVLLAAGVESTPPPLNVEVVTRGEVTFVLNHSHSELRVDIASGVVLVPAMDAFVIDADGAPLLRGSDRT